jgi:predicted acetyltransferase
MLDGDWSSDVCSSDLQVEYPWLYSYWIDPGRFPFLIFSGEDLAGFALVNSHTVLLQGARSVAEFYVVPRFRRQRIGKVAAFALFKKFPGRWEVRQLYENLVAQRFWRRVLSEYTGGRFDEIMLDDERWHGPVQCFDSSYSSLNAPS